MNTLRNWDTTRKEANGMSQPPRPVPTDQDPAYTVGDIQESLLPLYATGTVRTQESDAMAREDFTMLGLARRRRQANALYIAQERDIAACEYPGAQARMMRFDDMMEDEILGRTRRYMRRGSGVTQKTMTVQATQQDRHY